MRGEACDRISSATPITPVSETGSIAGLAASSVGEAGIGGTPGKGSILGRSVLIVFGEPESAISAVGRGAGTGETAAVELAASGSIKGGNGVALLA